MPSTNAEISAINQQHCFQFKFIKLAQLWWSNLTCPWDDASTTCKQIHPVADHTSPSAILCNASTIIFVLISNFLLTNYAACQWVQFLLLVLLLYITLAFIGQAIFEKWISTELSFLSTLGVGKRFLLVGYCSFQCLLLCPVLC